MSSDLNESRDWELIKERLERLFREAQCWKGGSPVYNAIEKKSFNWLNSPDNMSEEGQARLKELGLEGRTCVERKTLTNFWNQKNKSEGTSLETLQILAGTFNVPLYNLLQGGDGPGAKDRLEIIHHAIESNSDVNEFQRRLRLDTIENAPKAALKVLLTALVDAYSHRHLYYSTPTNPKLADKLRDSFCPMAKDLKLDVVNIPDWNQRSSAFPLIDRAVYVLSNFICDRLAERRKPGGKPTSIGIAVGSGGTVKEVMKQFFRQSNERIEEIKHAITHRHAILDFYPLAASVDTAHQTDDIPSLFLHQALTENDLAHLCTRIHSTPNHASKCADLEWMSENISAVVTSVADTNDEHSMLRSHVRAHKAEGLLKHAVGELQFRPYTDDAFIVANQKDINKLPATLCEMNTLVQLSRIPNKLVLLVAGKCLQRDCNLHKNKAIHPLLKNDKMRVFNHAIFDSKTAELLLNSLEERSKAQNDQSHTA